MIYLSYKPIPLHTKSPNHFIVNTVNCVGVMGNGLALEFKNLYPDMFTSYVNLCSKNKLNIGSLHIYRKDGLNLINFPTKTHWKNKSEFKYIELGLDKFISSYEKIGVESINFPLLGTGNGGLDKHLVLDLMILKLSKLPIDITIHLY